MDYLRLNDAVTSFAASSNIPAGTQASYRQANSKIYVYARKSRGDRPFSCLCRKASDAPKRARACCGPDVHDKEDVSAAFSRVPLRRPPFCIPSSASARPDARRTGAGRVFPRPSALPARGTSAAFRRSAAFSAPECRLSRRPVSPPPGAAQISPARTRIRNHAGDEPQKTAPLPDLHKERERLNVSASRPDAMP